MPLSRFSFQLHDLEVSGLWALTPGVSDEGADAEEDEDLAASGAPIVGRSPRAFGAWGGRSGECGARCFMQGLKKDFPPARKRWMET